MKSRSPQKHLKLFALILFVFSFAMFAHAGTFYVDNSGSPACANGASNGSQTSPWCTIPYGISRMAGGDTLIVKAGTYAGEFTITGPSGTSGAHTTIKTAPGATVILSGPGFNSGRIKITGGCSFIDFIGFTITNYNQGLYLDDDVGTSTPCSNVTVDGVTIHDVGQEGIAVRAGSASGPRNFVIKNSTVYNTGRLDPNQNGEGIYLGNSSAIDVTNGVTLLNNTIHDVTSECIELKGDSHDNIVDGNNLSHCITSGAGFGNGGGAIEIDEPRNTTTDPHQIVRNNVIHDLPNASGVTKRGIRAGTGATIYNNILYNIGSSYSCILSNSSNYSRLIYHNTVDCSASNAVVNSGTTADIRNNLGPAGTNNLTISSSYFVNYSAHDYRLLSSSAPINAGANLAATVPKDIAGTSRSTNGLPDLGAYEFASSSATAPEPPTSLTATVQ